MKPGRKDQCPRIRLAAVLIRNGKLLVVKHSRDSREYFLLPGGGLEWGETCAEGLARECREELDLEVRVGPLLWVNESIEPRGRRHILNLTFLAKIRRGHLQVQVDQRLKAACWVSPQALSGLTFYPNIRKEILAAWKQGFKRGLGFIPTAWD